MKSRRLTCVTATIALVALIVPFELAAQNQTRYRVIDVGTLVGGTFSNALGINNKGEVVGIATLANDTELHAFVWRKGVMTDLGTLAPADTLPVSFANWINDSDEIVGMSETSALDPLGEDICGVGDHLICLPVVWRNGEINALPTLGGNNGQALGINNRGQIVGQAETAQEDPTCSPATVLIMEPAIWENGLPRALLTHPFVDGGSSKINDKGQSVGNAFNCNFSAVKARLWEDNQAVDMGAPKGLEACVPCTPSPISINNRAQAAGTYGTLAGGNRGFVWQDGVFTDLGALPGHPQVFGNSISDSGQVTGQTCDLTESTCTSFVWRKGDMTDLNAVVPADTTLYMFDPNGINSAGEIVGLGLQITPNGLVCCHGFLAIPDNRAVANGTTGQADMREAQPIIIPESLRGMLKRGLGQHIRGLGVPKD